MKSHDCVTENKSNMYRYANICNYHITEEHRPPGCQQLHLYSTHIVSYMILHTSVFSHNCRQNYEWLAIAPDLSIEMLPLFLLHQFHLVQHSKMQWVFHCAQVMQHPSTPVRTHETSPHTMVTWKFLHRLLHSSERKVWCIQFYTQRISRTRIRT